MYDQVYKYLDLPGQVCEKYCDSFKTLCVISATAASLLSFFTSPLKCVLKVSHAEVWGARSAV